MPNNANPTSAALEMRNQALALLRQAEELDGLKPFGITHSHESGASTYMVWSKQAPTESQATAVLDTEFEPDKDEYLTIEENFSLEEVTGVSERHRLAAGDGQGQVQDRQRA